MTMALKKSVRFALQLLFSAAVLFWLSHSLGAADIAAAFGKISWPALAVGLGLYLVAQVLSAWRWWSFASILGFKASFAATLSQYFLGMFYNIFLPTGYGGDVVRVLALSPLRKRPSKSLALLSVFLDRLMGLLALLFLGALCSLMLGVKAGIWGWVMGLALGLGIGGFVAGLMFVSRFKKLSRKIRLVALLMRSRAPEFFRQGLLSFVVQALNILIYAHIFWQLGASLSFAAVGFGYGLVTIATLLPVSVGGLGVRESGWAGFLATLGASGELGVAAGLVYFLIQTLCSLLGLYPFLRARAKTSQESQSAA